MSLPQMILVVVDPGVRQSAATDRAIDLARRSGARLHLLMPVFDRRIDATAELVAPSVERLARQRFVASGHQWLAEWTRTLVSQQIRATCEVVWARIAHEAVVAAARAMTPDLVLKDMTRGRSRGRASTSSSDWRLARRCPAALMLVQQCAPPGAYLVTAAVDPERSQRNEAELDDRVVQAAQSLAMLVDTPLDLIHVFPTLEAEGEADPALDALVERLKRADAESFASFAERHRVPVGHRVLRMGEAVPQILQHVEERGVGLLVIGSQYWSDLDGHSLGSKAEALLAQAECDLLMVRPGGFAPAIPGQRDDALQDRGPHGPGAGPSGLAMEGPGLQAV